MLYEGMVMGHAQNVGLKYHGCTPHVHIEVYLKQNTLLDKTGTPYEDVLFIDPALLIEVH
jgi:hypothetical protein